MINILFFNQSYLKYSESFVKLQTNINTPNFASFLLVKTVKNKHLFKNDSLEIFSFGSLPIFKQFWENIFFQFGKSTVINKWIESKQINVIHSHFLTNGLLIRPTCQKLNLPHIIQCHGQDVFSLPQRIPRFSKKINKLINTEVLFLASSEHMKKYMTNKLGIPEKLILIHYVGMKTNKFLKHNINSMPDKNSLTFGMAGRFVEKKGHLIGLLAFSAIQKKHPNAKLIIWGDGPLKQKYLDFIQQNNLKNIVFKGEMSHELLLKDFAKVDIFLLPHQKAANGDQEAIPLILREVALLGKIFITTTHSGIPEVFKDNVNGFVVTEGDIESLVNKTEFILTLSPDKIKLIIEKARQSIIEKFNINNLNKKYLNIITNFIKNK